MTVMVTMMMRNAENHILTAAIVLTAAMDLISIALPEIVNVLWDSST